MVITIGKKEYEVRFGLGFLRALNEKYFRGTTNGMKFGIGLESRLPFLLDEDPLVLSEFLYEGCGHLKERPKQGEIDSYVENHENIAELFAEVIDELKKGNATSKKTLAMTEALEAEKAKGADE